tara:strand:- start:591 stop:1139 length:549 start_codon:yes stop_codon:yes gene_type:complete
MKHLLPILCLFVFSCDDDSNPVAPEGYVLLWGNYYNIEGTTKLDNDGEGHGINNIDCQNLVGQSIPSKIQNLVNLSFIDLDGCGLVGEIPSEIGNLTNLTHLYLGDNQLSGQIPSEIGNLNLYYLSLTNNQFTGEIPNSICNLSLSFSSIYNNTFYNNKFCPPYPECLTEEDIGEQDTSNCP